jgi:hypothetical protein
VTDLDYEETAAGAPAAVFEVCFPAAFNYLYKIYERGFSYWIGANFLLFVIAVST